VTTVLSRELFSLYEFGIARQWLSEYVPVTINTHTTIEELLDTVFSVGCVISKEGRQLALSRT
jgi:hypothetical protein